MAHECPSVRKAFADFDVEGTGAISREDLARIMKEIGQGEWTDAHFETMCEAAGVGETTDIKIDPFVSWVFSQQTAEATAKAPQDTDELPGWPSNGTAPLPDLTNHYSVVAAVLKKDGAATYSKLQNLRTQFGVSLAQCIKTGIDNKGHKLIKTVGLVAGDAHCYETFKELFLPVIMLSHPNHAESHQTDLDVEKVTQTSMDPFGSYVTGVQARLSRNIAGFRFLGAISREERREVERLLSRSLVSIQDLGLKGEYYPLKGSGSFMPRPLGMSEDEEAHLKAGKIMLEEPDSAVLLSAGIGRHWPEARGVFASEDLGFAALVNEVDHLRLSVRQRGSDMFQAFERVARAEVQIRECLERAGHKFAHSEALGFLTTCPSNLGTSLQLTVTLKLQQLSSKPEFKKLCKELGLTARPSAADTAAALGGNARYMDVSCVDRLGSSEVDQVNSVIEGCRKLVDMERDLDEKAGLIASVEEKPEEDEVFPCADDDGLPA